jgi:DNA-binding Xre family transcriptional regulator
MAAKTKLSRTKDAKKTAERLEKLLDDGSREFNDLVQQRLHELLFVRDIADLRRQRGWSQTKLAARAGFSQPFIAKLESGAFRNVEVKTLVRIATALNASLQISLTSNLEPPPLSDRARASGRLHP